MSIPPQICKAPLLKTFWRRFWFEISEMKMVKFNLKFEQKRVSTGPYVTMKYIEYISQTSDTPW